MKIIYLMLLALSANTWAESFHFIYDGKVFCSEKIYPSADMHKCVDDNKENVFIFNKKIKSKDGLAHNQGYYVGEHLYLFLDFSQSSQRLFDAASTSKMLKPLMEEGKTLAEALDSLFLGSKKDIERNK
ncbi:hypothetical protein [Pleionea sp. CnH1-48]|uniref:hypothetical protein n=1 Tax=Pleionea sp. CnH1-48 TaxID=2954494 RepID=UPI002096B6C7|nr:hypothetical protein [Pleionea sp. CnH1-48]MCO7223062.1 hypothetical protein [Pleionea sp. CnH1-48]